MDLTEQERQLIINAVKLADDDTWQKIIKQYLPEAFLVEVVANVPVSGNYIQASQLAAQIDAIIKKLQPEPENSKVSAIQEAAI